MEWIDCNVGGRLTMKHPCALLEGEDASAEAVSITCSRAIKRLIELEMSGSVG